MSAYLDASAVVKLVDREAESDALRRYLIDQPDGRAVSCALVETEARRAAMRKGVSQAQVTAVLDRLDLADIDRALLTEAGLLPGPHLRALDALHIAAAIRSGESAFVTYDERQAHAARECGLHVISPV